ADLKTVQSLKINTVEGNIRCEVRIHNHQKFINTIEGDTKSIGKEVAKHDCSARLTITDVADNLILTTIGNLLDYVPDKKCLQDELLPILIPIQMGEEEF